MLHTSPLAHPSLHQFGGGGGGGAAPTTTSNNNNSSSAGYDTNNHGNANNANSIIGGVSGDVTFKANTNNNATPPFSAGHYAVVTTSPPPVENGARRAHHSSSRSISTLGAASGGGGDRKLAFGQLRQAVSCQLCDLLDEAHINATRVVSGRRFVRWDTVPKLLAQQNAYISGLPYDFFFSKSVLTLGRVPVNGGNGTGTLNGNVNSGGNGGGVGAMSNSATVVAAAATPHHHHQSTGSSNPTEPSYNLGSVGHSANSTTIATTAAGGGAVADWHGERHNHKNHVLPPHQHHRHLQEPMVEEDELVDDNDDEEEDENDGGDEEEDDDELDGSSSSRMDATPSSMSSSGSPGAGSVTMSSTPAPTTTPPPPQNTTNANVGASVPDLLLASGPYNSPHHCKSPGNRFAPQQQQQPTNPTAATLNQPTASLLAQPVSSPPAPTTGVAAEAHIPISSLDGASIVAILHAQPLNINILSWKKQTIEEILALLRLGKIRVAPRPQGRDVVFELVMPNGNTVDVPKWPDVFPSAAAAMVMANLSQSNNNHNVNGANTAERVAFPSATAASSMSPALDGGFDASGNEALPLRDGGGVIRTSRDREKRRGISAGPASSSVYERARTMSGGGASGANPASVMAAGLSLKLRMDGRAATPSSSSVASPDRESSFPYSQRGRRLTSIKGEGHDDQDGSGDKMVHHYTLTPSSFHPYQPSMAQVVTGNAPNAAAERVTNEEMLSPSSSNMAEDPPTRGRSFNPAGAFLTTPTPTKKWTRRSSPDRIYMNVTLNSLLRTAGMPIPRQKDDASRLPWSSIPQFLAEKQLYIAGWPEANLPWLYSGDEPKPGVGGGNQNAKGQAGGGPKLPNGSMGEWKDRIDWKSSPSQRSYKPLAQALRSGEIKILPRPKGREVIFEVKDAQGRVYDTTLGLSEEWKRKWMYSGEKQQQHQPYHQHRDDRRHATSAVMDMEEDSKADSMSVDDDIEQKRAAYRAHNRRSFDMHRDAYDKFSPERSTPSSFGHSSPAPPSHHHHHHHTMRRMSYPFPPASSSSSYQPPYAQHIHPYGRQGPDTPSRYSSSSHGLDERSSREYMESSARYQQQLPESSLRDSRLADDGASRDLEDDMTSPGSSRQRTTSLGTSSPSSGAVLSPGLQHSLHSSNNNKMGYALPPLSQMDIDMDDPKVNKLPPIRGMMYDSDEEPNRPLHPHHPLNLPHLSASSTSLSSSGVPATPNNPYLTTTPPRSHIGYNSSSPRMSVEQSYHRRDPSPPETTNKVPTHLPKPDTAFSQAYWEPKELVWRLNVQDPDRAALPPVGDKVCWDSRCGKWRVAWHTRMGETNAGYPVAYWSPDKEAWTLNP